MLRALAMTALVAARPALPGEVERFAGVARGEGGRVVYLEEHEVRREGGRIREAVTRYLDPGGALVATLASSYAHDLYAADYTFVLHRSGEVEGTRWEGGRLVAFTGAREAEVRAPDDRVLASGQGLNALARDRLEALARGETVEAHFVLPSRLDGYAFRLRAVPAPFDDRVALRVEPSSAVLRLLAPSLYVEYERATGRLLRYRGVSNVPDARGEAQRVEITYRYESQGAPHGHERDLAAAHR